MRFHSYFISCQIITHQKHWISGITGALSFQHCFLTHYWISHHGWLPSQPTSQYHLTTGHFPIEVLARAKGTEIKPADPVRVGKHSGQKFSLQQTDDTTPLQCSLPAQEALWTARGTNPQPLLQHWAKRDLSCPALLLNYLIKWNNIFGFYLPWNTQTFWKYYW